MPQRGSASQGRISLRLLGGWQLVDNGAELRLSHREQRLIALLGLSGERARPHVAGVLWPDSTDERALASLRRAVMQTQHARPGLLHAGRAFVGLDPEIEVDVAEVRRAAEVSELPESDDERSHLLTLLSGEELLPGWYDDWVLAERESLEQMRLRALDRLSRQALDRGDLVLAIDAARSATDIEPHSEAACEVALRAHLARGDLAGVVSEYRRHRDATWDNVGVAPSHRILALVESAVGTTLLEDATPVPGTIATDPPSASVCGPATRHLHPRHLHPRRRRLWPRPRRLRPSCDHRPAAAGRHRPRHRHAAQVAGGRAPRSRSSSPTSRPRPPPFRPARNSRPAATHVSSRGWSGRRSCCSRCPSWWPSVARTEAGVDRRPARGRRHRWTRPAEAMVHRTALRSSTGSRRSSASSRPASCPAWPGSP